MKIVLATYQEFLRWCRENETTPNQHVHVSSVWSLRGLDFRKSDLVILQTHHYLELGEIWDQIKCGLAKHGEKP